jgi:acetyl-CoA carboxylase carboxyltransferase component
MNNDSPPAAKEEEAQESTSVVEPPTSDMRLRVAKLHERRAKIREMGGEKRIARQHGRGKMTARERIAVLVDDGTFLELGIQASEYEHPNIPADGVITGVGQIDGRMACIVAYDFTVLGGSIGMMGERKVSRVRELALRDRIPMVWLVDSAGARIDPRPENADKIPTFCDSGYLFREQVTMSGVIPQVAAMLGPGMAGTAYIPGLADFVPMVKGTSSMALAGPALVKAAVGEDIDENTLGGSVVHNRHSGCADLETASDAECLEAVKKYLSFFPSSCSDKPPILDNAPGKGLIDDAILDVLPDDTRFTYDVRKLIPFITDDGELFEMKPKFAKSMVTGLTRIGGYPIGIVANNPKYLGGVLNSEASYKAARFVSLCDAFNIPLLFLVDVPGFIVGSHAEKGGIINHGSRMLFEVARATVPKFTIITRKAYGAGYYVMCGRAFEPDLIMAWPTAEISVMGPDGMIGIAAGKLFNGMTPEQAAPMRAQMVEVIKGYITPEAVARRAFVDDVIDPRETRDVLITGLQMTRNKVVERPWRRHLVTP